MVTARALFRIFSHFYNPKTTNRAYHKRQLVGISDRFGGAGVYVYFNPNPVGRRAGDCVIRAICAASGKTWEDVFRCVCAVGYELGDMPSADYIWGEYLRRCGFSRYAIPAEYGAECTVREFAERHKQGVFILAIAGHVVCVIDGDWLDSWNSGDCVPVYYWAKQKLREGL